MIHISLQVISNLLMEIVIHQNPTEIKLRFVKTFVKHQATVYEAICEVMQQYSQIWVASYLETFQRKPLFECVVMIVVQMNL